MEATLKQIGSHIRQVATEVDLTDEVRARAAQTADAEPVGTLFDDLPDPKGREDAQPFFVADVMGAQGALGTRLYSNGVEWRLVSNDLAVTSGVES